MIPGAFFNSLLLFEQKNIDLSALTSANYQSIIKQDII